MARTTFDKFKIVSRDDKSWGEQDFRAKINKPTKQSFRRCVYCGNLMNSFDYDIKKLMAKFHLSNPKSNFSDYIYIFQVD